MLDYPVLCAPFSLFWPQRGRRIPPRISSSIARIPSLRVSLVKRQKDIGESWPNCGWGTRSPTGLARAR